MANSNVPNLYPVPSAVVVGERKTVSSSAVQLAATDWSFANSKYVQWQCQTDSIYVTFDGSTPSSTNGFELSALQSGTWDLVTAKAAKMIRKTNDAYLYAQPFTI